MSTIEEFATRTPSPYRQALEFIERHPGTGSANGLAKLLLSLWNGEDCGFSFRECIQSLDDDRRRLALACVTACVTQFAARGEDAELVAVGYRVVELYPRLWELGQAAMDAKAHLRRQWEEERERQQDDES